MIVVKRVWNVTITIKTFMTNITRLFVRGSTTICMNEDLIMNLPITIEVFVTSMTDYMTISSWDPSLCAKSTTFWFYPDDDVLVTDFRSTVIPYNCCFPNVSSFIWRTFNRGFTLIFQLRHAIKLCQVAPMESALIYGPICCILAKYLKFKTKTMMTIVTFLSFFS